jgi:REP element-mobilizing transposase RayT
MYHVINRGNYRHDVFGSVGAAQAFESVLADCCERYRWQLHAYVVMRNHFHLAMTTPEPNLTDGMHWLQGTFATRFNRMRHERGHLFQGRYHALLIEDGSALTRVVDYIHLNPVRAKLVPPAQAGAFRWSSLRRYRASARPKWLACGPWLDALGLDDTADGWRRYAQHLAELGGDQAEQERMGFPIMCQGWAIGTAGWRNAVAKDHAQLALTAGLAGDEVRAIKQARWTAELDRALRRARRTMTELECAGPSAPWKIEIAHQLRHAGASCSWITQALRMGTPGALRVRLCRSQRAANK